MALPAELWAPIPLRAPSRAACLPGRLTCRALLLAVSLVILLDTYLLLASLR